MDEDEIEDYDYYTSREEVFEERARRKRWEDEINERSKPL